MTQTIIILFGGQSDERHVSVASAQNIANTIGQRAAGSEQRFWFDAPNGAIHDVAPAELLAHARPFEIDFMPSRPAIWPNLEQALDTIPVDDPLFLLGYHGGAGEDGRVQAMLEKRGLPFTGSGSETSAIAFDKDRTKERLAGRVRVAESRVVSNAAEARDAIGDLLSRHERLVLKPLRGGSSRGLMFIDTPIDFDPPQPYIVEQFIRGRELTVGVIDRGDGPFSLPVIEIEIDPGASFDYEGKYLGKGTREICPANISAEMAREAQATALAAHLGLGCRGYSRSDMMAADDGIYFLELNTLPGLTTSSLVPQQLREAGIAFGDFLDEQLAIACGVHCMTS
ncbi:MAG TPA: ATP-grasp domain-containing protein [Thermoanaerobaculia bacterium]|nr:ATP-grasp domain-containing protein [Thermoanaerobaculia bacterium]